MLMLFVVLASVMGGEAGAVVVVVVGREEVAARRDCGDPMTWSASYRPEGRRTAEAVTNDERHQARCLPKAARDAASGQGYQAAFAAGSSKEADATGLLDEGCRNRDMKTGTFVSRDLLGLVDGPNVYCYVRRNPSDDAANAWTGRDSSLFGEGASHGLDHVIRDTGNFGTGFFSPRMRSLYFR